MWIVIRHLPELEIQIGLCAVRIEEPELVVEKGARGEGSHLTLRAVEILVGAVQLDG